MVVARQSEPETGAADRLDIRLGQILLAEMHEAAPRLDGQPPVVVDHQKTVVVPGEPLRAGDLAGKTVAVISLIRSWIRRTPSGTSRSTQSALSTMG